MSYPRATFAAMSTNPPMYISASSYTKFRTCPRLFLYEQILGITLVRDEGARRFGTLYHAGLEAWWREMAGRPPWTSVDAALVAAIKGIAENARHVQTDPFEVARAEVMIVGYHATYLELDFTLPELPGGGVETSFDVALRDPEGKVIPGWRLRGKKDALVRFNSEDRSKVVEHKTSGQEIGAGSDYWARLSIDTQSSIYIEAAQQLGHDVDTVLYDVSRKPEARPLLATPLLKRKMTKGKGCTLCGGRAGGKLGVAQGTGEIMVEVTVGARKEERPAKCSGCAGSGWTEAPRLNAKQRDHDEDVMEFKARLNDEIIEEPNTYYRQGDLRRDPDALAEARADLMITTGEIGALVTLSRNTERGMSSRESRRCWPRNTQACTNVYGRRCDFIDICAGTVNPYESTLYQIKPRKEFQ